MEGFDFSGQAVLVTGASSGIGLAVARAFARAKADLTILAIDAGIEEAGRRIGQDCGRRIATIQCDVADREAVVRCLAPLKRIDVLVHNAGLELITPIEEPGEKTEVDFRRVIDVNLMGSFYVTRHALSRMPDGSRIVYTASTYAKTAVALMNAYCASKHGLVGMMRSLAFELGPRKICVNAICPGWVKTDQSMRSVSVIAEQTERSLEVLTSELLSKQALNGMLMPDDVAGAYLFLASQYAKDITGQTLHVDRGEVMD
jgi:3-hydroxybutyrate dehydrogenase